MLRTEELVKETKKRRQNWLEILYLKCSNVIRDKWVGNWNEKNQDMYLPF